jgi:hypothetical protein
VNTPPNKIKGIIIKGENDTALYGLLNMLDNRYPNEAEQKTTSTVIR